MSYSSCDSKLWQFIISRKQQMLSIRWINFVVHFSGEDEKPILNATQRREIAVGIARGLDYLHSFAVRTFLACFFHLNLRLRWQSFFSIFVLLPASIQQLFLYCKTIQSMTDLSSLVACRILQLFTGISSCLTYYSINTMWQSLQTLAFPKYLRNLVLTFQPDHWEPWGKHQNSM